MVNKLTQIYHKTTTFIAEVFTKRDTIKGLLDIIKNQNARIKKLEDDRVLIYNLAASQMLGKSYKLETYSGQNKFWNGRLGIKSNRIVTAYRSNTDMVEVPITFENTGDTYYWYFLTLDEEE